MGQTEAVASADDARATVRRMIEAAAAGDAEALAAVVAPDVTASITNAAGGADRVRGREAFLARLSDPGSADEFALTITQVASVDAHLVLVMVEIRARRGGRSLHNHAAFLVRVDRRAVTDLWMVEALPADSAEFWS